MFSQLKISDFFLLQILNIIHTFFYTYFSQVIKIVHKWFFLNFFALQNSRHSELLGFRTLYMVRYTKTRKHNISETGFFQSWGEGGDTYSVRSLRKSQPQSLDNPCLSLMLRPMASRPICLGIKHPTGAYDQIFITVRELQFCWCGALSQTRGLVCRLQWLLGLASAVMLGFKSRGTHDHILLSQIRDFPFRRLLRLAGLRRRYSTPPPHVRFTTAI
jgi:hypothetical protein